VPQLHVTWLPSLRPFAERVSDPAQVRLTPQPDNALSGAWIFNCTEECQRALITQTVSPAQIQYRAVFDASQQKVTFGNLIWVEKRVEIDRRGCAA
jgi:hypothetical protein